MTPGVASPAGSIVGSTACERIRASLARSLALSSGVVTLWAIVALLIAPFYMFSQQELAPPEDQGVVFSIIQAAPNATIEQTKLFAQQINDVYKSFPESAGTFELTYPERRVRRHTCRGVSGPRRRSSCRWWRDRCRGFRVFARFPPRHLRCPAVATFQWTS